MTGHFSALRATQADDTMAAPAIRPSVDFKVIDLFFLGEFRLIEMEAVLQTSIHDSNAFSVYVSCMKRITKF